MYIFLRKLEELSTSDSEQTLDEIVVATLGSEVSPIHYCDQPSTSYAHKNKLSKDDKGAIIKISSLEEAHNFICLSQKLSSNIQCGQQPSSSLDPSSAYKNSKTRRSEYSMRGIKLGCSNPSQDSAFGSMTDGELSRASSFKLSSFQSVTASSPIDEGVEDILEDKVGVGVGDSNSSSIVTRSLKFIDSNSSCSSPCFDNFTQSLNDLNIPITLNPTNSTNIKETCIFFDPPKLIVNDGKYIHTSSPIRKCAKTESFSQKYRVSSFEDMGFDHLKNQILKKPFRSFEEEQRIESAFTPINSSIEALERVNRYSPVMYLSGRERSVMWKSNKNNLTVKSTESICDKEADLSTNTKIDGDESNEEDEEKSTENLSHRKGSERLLFSLGKFKQNAIGESLDTLSETSCSRNNKLSNSSSSTSNIDNTTITSTTNDECYSEEECSMSEEYSENGNSIDEVRKFVKGFDLEESSRNSEALPLLGFEMHSLSSSTEAE